jgi:hypothetical protein
MADYVAGQVPPEDDEFHRVVRRFAKSHRTLLARDPEPLAEFATFRNAVLDAIESPAVIEETSRALADLHRDANTAEAAHLLVMELDAFAAAVDRPPAVAMPTAAVAPAGPVPEPHRSWWKRLLGIGKTAGDSLCEILEKYLGPKGKAIWKILGELLDIARGD